MTKLESDMIGEDVVIHRVSNFVRRTIDPHPEPDPYVWHKTSDFDPPTRWPWEHE